MYNNLIFQNWWTNEKGEKLFHFHLKICRDFASGGEQTFCSVIINMTTREVHIDRNDIDLYAVKATREKLAEEAFVKASKIQAL